MTSWLAWYLVGGSQIVLGFAHVILWRRFGWTKEIAQLSPLAARVFAVHTFFVAFLLVALGALEASRPDLLETRGDFARLYLAATTLFWFLRLVAQPLVFDPVRLPGSSWRMPLRIAASSLFLLYFGVHALALARHCS